MRDQGDGGAHGPCACRLCQVLRAAFRPSRRTLPGARRARGLAADVRKRVATHAGVRFWGLGTLNPKQWIVLQVWVLGSGNPKTLNNALRVWKP
jgi:hypothetical protein